MASRPIRFQSTLPAGGATTSPGHKPIRHSEFQSTLPAGGATGPRKRNSGNNQHFNPRSPRGERQEIYLQPVKSMNISIHAPRGGSDVLVPEPFVPYQTFQSTLPAGGATVPCFSVFPVLFLFQSTLPAGGATCDEFQVWYHKVISIHAPRGGSDSRLKSCEEASDCISIHAPRGGSDMMTIHQNDKDARISIHAPRGGSDQPLHLWICGIFLNFNPRSPRGERPSAGWRTSTPRKTFQSTLPAGGATLL